jgi:hypothetical protein
MAQVANFQVPAHPSGLEMRTQMNQIILALVSSNSGPVAPVQTYPLMWWGDTTANRLRIRNMANDAWTDLGPINDFLADIRSLVETTAAQKVNRGGDYMTGTLLMRNANLFFQNGQTANYGYIGAYGNAGAGDSGIGFVDSSLTLWNFQLNNNGNWNARGSGQINGGLRIDGGRLQMRQPGSYGEIAMYSANGTVMYMRGRSNEGGGMQWIDNNYTAVVGDMDNAGNLRLTGSLATGNGSSNLGPDGNIVSSLFPAGIHAYINNVANAAAAGRAAAGAQCWWNTGPQDSGWINPNGYQTADVAVPWVMCGLRESGGGMIYLRATNLRNQQ